MSLRWSLLQAIDLVVARSTWVGELDTEQRDVHRFVRLPAGYVTAESELNAAVKALSMLHKRERYSADRTPV